MINLPVLRYIYFNLAAQVKPRLAAD